MVAVIGANPKTYFTDLNGNPLSGGKVYTYAAGTLTPQATYADYDQNATLPNPIILDSSGMATIYWLPGTLYKVVVSDQDDVELYTVDDYAAPGSGGSSSNPGFGAATDVASSTTVDLGSIASHFAVITGTTTVNSFGTSASTDAPLYLVRIQSPGLTLTYSSNLLNPWTKDIITTQNDYFFADYLGVGVWKIFSYFRGDGSIDATTVNCDVINVTTTTNLS